MKKILGVLSNNPKFPLIQMIFISLSFRLIKGLLLYVIYKGLLLYVIYKGL